MYRSQLSFWLGVDDAARAQPAGVSPRAELPPLATLEARLEEHPAQLDYMRRIDAANTAADVARELRKPSWMLDVSYGFRQGMPDGRDRPDMLSAMVTVGLPLSRGNRQDRAVSAAKLEAQALHERHDDHDREMRAMLHEAWSTAQRTAELERFYETDLLPLAGQSITAALLGWRSNRAMLEEVVMARRLALEVRLKHLRLAADRALAQHDIDYFTGDAR
jgi:outer membrane protein TolC